MQILIERFGPINKFEFDLEKELIVTYGNNNIGKSYAMQIVYLLLKTFLHSQFMAFGGFSQMYIYPKGISMDIPGDKIENIVKQFIESTETSKDITQEIVCELYNMMSAVYMPEFINSCRNTFGNWDKTLEADPKVTVKYREFEFVIDLCKKKIEGKLDTKPVMLKKTKSGFHKSRNSSSHLDIYVIDEIEQPTNLILQEIQKKFQYWVKVFFSEYENVFFLPASRSGIYSGMNAFGSIVAELSKNRAYFTKKIEFPGISEPISDYFIFLSNIKTKMNETFEEFYEAIETKILRGKVTFDKNKNALMYKPDNVDAAFEMTEVSSMVSEVSPIVAFLKYILSGKKIRRGKSILFIEEPEAHLHPKNQIALIEIFTKLIKANVKLIMSSHSNYVFNKLNNLVLSRDLDYQVYQPIVLQEMAGGSQSKFISIDELGADDENFVDVSEQLFYEREEIIQNLNMEE